MRKKSTRLKKLLIILLCFVNVLGSIKIARAEDRIIPVEYDVKYLTKAPTITSQGAVENSAKYLMLGEDDKGKPSTITAPFDTVLTFPYVEAIKTSETNTMLPSEYILGQLKNDFEYWVWNLDEYPRLQLPIDERYVLHVGNDIGLPKAAFWGIRKISENPYDEDFAIEHTFGYINKRDEWVEAVTKKGRWGLNATGDTESWVDSETIVNKQIYWKEIMTPDIENISPIVNQIIPVPDKSINIDNTGTIEGVLIDRKGEVGQAYDFVSDLKVQGAVTNQLLTHSDIKPIPNMNFGIEHDVEGIRHLIENGIYTGIGSGKVTSTVTDYEEDATIFTQEVVVSTDGSPGVNIYRAGTNVLYEKEWMSNDKSADDWRQEGLDLEADSTINGTYDLATRVKGLEVKRETVMKDGEKERVVGERVYGWTNEDTSADGIPVTSIAHAVGDYGEPISAESDAKYMRSDSVVPTISWVEFEGEWEKMIDHNAYDQLSGLNEESGGIHYRFVKRDEGVEPPTIATLDKKNEWESLLNSYKLPDDIGEYDLYVYAKDNATNRSEVLKLNKDPITIDDKSPAKVRLKKKVSGDEGNDTDTFVIHMDEGTTRLGSVALKRDETSDWMSLDMKKGEKRTIKVTEVVPMDYVKEYRIYVADAGEKPKLLDKGKNEIILNAGDELTITIENTFEHAGYFRGKDVVKNIFWPLM